MTNTEATGDNFQVFLKPKCDPAVAAFAPNQWRLDHGRMLLLSAKGDTWQFEADDNAQWRRVPDTADPLIMMRRAVGFPELQPRAKYFRNVLSIRRAARFVVSHSETVLRGDRRRNSPQREFCHALHVYRHLVRTHGGPTPALMEAMGKLADREIKAGRMIDTGGLMPLRHGRAGADHRRQAQRESTVPSSRAKEVIGGYAIFELRDKDEAWRAAEEFMQLHLDHMPGWDGTCELRAFATPGVDGACEVDRAAHA